MARRVGRVSRKCVVIGGAAADVDGGDRKVLVDPKVRATVNPPLSARAHQEIDRMEAAEARARANLKWIVMGGVG